MAVEKWIRGKYDSGHHEGKRSEIRRIQEAKNQVLEYGKGDDWLDRFVGQSNRDGSFDYSPSPQLNY